MLISEKVDFITRNVIRKKEGYFRMIKNVNSGGGEKMAEE